MQKVSRPYKEDRRYLALIRQWFSPLPKRPDPEPLKRRALEKRLRAILIAPADSAQSDARAKALLDEASLLYANRDERIRTWETKASTLLGAVAIAVSLMTAGAALLLDPTKVPDDWRLALSIGYSLPLAFLIFSGYLASRALMKVFLVSRPQSRQAAKRAVGTGPARNAEIHRAIDLIDRAGRNLYVADFKLAQVRGAYAWYRMALAAFLVLGILIAVCAATRA